MAHLKLKNLWGAWGGSRNGSVCPNSEIYHESPPAYSDSQANRLSTLHIVRAIALVLLRILVFILIALAIIPVALLPVSTTVPPSIQILFAMAEVALLVAMFRLGFTMPIVLVELAGFVAIALLAIFASQVFASTPPILDAIGNPIPNSIAVLEKVKLGGSEEWITIRRKDSRNPVLLFLAGGPGGSQLVSERRALAGLEDRFVVVNWEQPFYCF